MNPFYFGTGDGLFGIHTPPQMALRGPCAALICAPIGQEYIRVHRALVRLGLELASRGVHVLRFDYRGCGDSLGEFTDFGPDDWTADITEAFDEMISGTGATRTTVIGVRIGALFAATCLHTARRADNFVLWEPVLDGDAFVRELHESHRSYMEGLWVDTAAIHDREQSVGYKFTNVLRARLKRLRLPDRSTDCGFDRMLIVRQEQDAFAPSFTKMKDISIDQVRASNLGFWKRTNQGPEKGMIPADAIAKIATWVVS